MQSFINRVNGIAEMKNISKKDFNRILSDLMGELDAIIDYNETIEETQNEDIKRVITDIRNEEQMHVGQLMNLLLRDQNFKTNFNMGMEHNRQLLEE